MFSFTTLETTKLFTDFTKWLLVEIIVPKDSVCTTSISINKIKTIVCKNLVTKVS